MVSVSASPRVSVIVPLYNGGPDLPHLGDCLLAQDYDPQEVEYLLVNNNSQDDTAPQLEALAQRAAAQGITLRPLMEREIQSSYAARNRGIQAARGEILLFTDGDCRPQADWVRRMVAPFQEDSVGLVVGEVKALPGKTLLERYADYRNMIGQSNTLNHPFCPYGQTANLGVRRAALAEVGLFRPYLTTGGDADLCWRVLRQSRWQLRAAADGVVYHRHRATLKELASQWQRYGRSNRYLHDLHGAPLKGWGGAWSVIAALGRWLGRDLPRQGWQSLRGQAPWVSLVAAPLDLFCGYHYSRGQRQARLPEAAHRIPPLAPDRASIPEGGRIH